MTIGSHNYVQDEDDVLAEKLKQDIMDKVMRDVIKPPESKTHEAYITSARIRRDLTNFDNLGLKTRYYRGDNTWAEVTEAIRGNNRRMTWDDDGGFTIWN